MRKGSSQQDSFRLVAGKLGAFGGGELAHRAEWTWSFCCVEYLWGGVAVLSLGVGCVDAHLWDSKRVTGAAMARM